jgi:RNA polymerase sigma-70 factor (ECF subfamily)
MTTTPVSLLERLRLPDQEAAWQRFVELYTPLLHYWARRAGLRGQDADDLVQDVFALLIRKLPDFVHDGRRSFRSWLRTVTLNRWRERYRREGARPQAAGIDGNHLAGPDALEAYWEQEYRQHLVGQAVEVMRSEFQPTTWKACWEVVVAERPPAEVAAELGLTVNAVYLARARVLRRLREELAGLLE